MGILDGKHHTHLEKKTPQSKDLFIHSGHFYSASSSPLIGPTHRRSRQSTNTVSEFHAEAPRATASVKEIINK